MTVDRSARQEVANPVLALPSAQRLLDLPEGLRALLADFLGELALDCRARAEKCWRTHKAPMAAYWKATSVYAGHLRRILRKPREWTMTITTHVDRKYDLRVGGEIVQRDLSHMAADAEATALVAQGTTCEVHCTTVTTTTDRRRVRRYEP